MRSVDLRTRSGLKRAALTAGTLVLLYLALRVSMAGLASATGYAPLPLELDMLDERLPVLFRAHMVFAAVALLLIVAAIISRRVAPRWHRALGRAAAGAIIAGGLTALPTAALSLASPPTRAGFFVQGVVWIALLTAGWRAIRRGDRRTHRQMMLAMAAVASGAIWVRLALLLLATMQTSPGDAYALIAWSAWLVPLAVVLAFTRERFTAAA